MPLINANGCDFYYEMRGSGPNLVFIHGEIHGLEYWEGQFAEFAFGKAPFDDFELLQRGGGLALIAIRLADLIIVGHAEIVGCERKILARRVHPLEVAQLGGSLRILVHLVKGESDPKLGLFGVRAEWILIDEMLVVVDRAAVLAHRIVGLALRPVVFAAGYFALAASGAGHHQHQRQCYQSIAIHHRIAN